MTRSVTLAFLLAFAPTVQGQVDKILRDFPHGVDCLAFSPDGKTLATGTRASAGGKDAVTLWDVATGKELCRLDGDDPFGCSSLTFSPDGKTLITNGGPKETLLLWDVMTRKVRLAIKVPPGVGGHLSVSPDSRTLAASGHGPPVHLYDTQTGKERLSLKGDFQALSVVFSPDGKMIGASTYEGSVGLWDSTTGRQLALLKRHTETVRSIAFSPDSKSLYSVGQDRLLVYWDTATGKERKAIDAGEGRRTQFGALSPDGKTLAVLGGGCLRLFDLNRADFWPGIAWNNQRGRHRCVAFSPDGTKVAIGSGGSPATNSVYLYDIPQLKPSE
jgi:WD40 repeat protein